MIFKVGQEVCLWEIKSEIAEGKITVLKEVIVTIMETKKWSEGPFKNLQGLRAMEEEKGTLLEKHWRVWPGTTEVKLANRHLWSECTDFSVTPHRKWVPYEAVSVYNLKPKDRVKIFDSQGQLIEPKKASYCKEHDRYSFVGEKCTFCPVDSKKKVE